MVTQEVTNEWLDGDEGDMGYQELSDNKIIFEVIGYADIENEGNSDSNDVTPSQ